MAILSPLRIFLMQVPFHFVCTLDTPSEYLHINQLNVDHNSSIVSRDHEPRDRPRQQRPNELNLHPGPPQGADEISIAVATRSSVSTWQDRIDIHNDEWMSHIGRVCRNAVGPDNHLSQEVHDLWGPRWLPDGRTIYYATTLSRGLPRQSLADILAWAIEPDDRNRDELLDPNANPQVRATPWLRTTEYILMARIPQRFLDGHVDLYVTITIITLPNHVRSSLMRLSSTLHSLHHGLDAREEVRLPATPPQVPAFWMGFGLHRAPGTRDPPSRYWPRGVDEA